MRRRAGRGPPSSPAMIDRAVRLSEIADQFVGFRGRAVDHDDAAKRAILQAGHDSARRAAGADHQRRIHIFNPGFPQGSASRLSTKPDHIRVVAPEHAVLDPEVLTARTRSARAVPASTAGEGRLLVRDRHVAAGETTIGEGLEKLREIPGATSMRS